MSKMRSFLPVLAVAALATALPALAETFTVVLKNGAEFETRYPPRPVDWDEGRVLLVTGTGNRITLARDDIETITTDAEVGGYATVLDTTTLVIGPAPNDARLPGEEPQAQGDTLTQVLRYLQRWQAQRRPQTANVEQFVDPPVAGEDRAAGFPLSYLQGATTWDLDLLGLQGLTPSTLAEIQGLPPGAVVATQGPGQFGGAVAAAAAAGGDGQ